MSVVLTLARREYLAYFRLGVGWAVMVLFLSLSGLVFGVGSIRPGEPATMRAFFGQCIVLLLPMAPAISMRLFSDDLRLGTLETMLSAPVGEAAIVLGKYLGAIGFLVTMLAPTLAFPLTLILVSSPAPDLGPVLAGYACIALLGGLYLAAGVVGSALTSSQTLAFLSTLLALIALMVGLAEAADRLPGAYAGIASSASPSGWVRDFAKGVVDVGHVVGFLSWIGFFLALGVSAIEARRWWGGGTRWSRGAWSAGFVALAGAVAVLAGVVGASAHRAGISTRFDVTRTSDHRLAPATTRLLDALGGSYQVIVAGDLSSRDPHGVRRLRDVLGEMERRGLGARVLDTSSPRGAGEFEAALADLARRERADLDARLASVRAWIADAGALGERLDALARGLVETREAIPDDAPAAAANHAYFEDRATRLRLAARALADASARAGSLLAGAGPPDTDAAGALVLAPLDGLDAGLARIGEDLAAFAGAEAMPEAARDRARGLVAMAAAARDACARARAAIEDTPPSEYLRVSRLLESAEAAVLVGPPGSGRASLGAIRLDDLLPAGGGESGAWSGPGIENVIAGALASRSQGLPPIVVLVHAHWEPILAPGGAIFSGAIERLGLRGIDVVEWATAFEGEPRHLARLLAREPGRPVVYVTHATDGAARAPAEARAGVALDGPARVARYAQALDSLVERGENVLVSIAPSLAASFTGSDPAVRALDAVGVRADSARPLFQEDVVEGTRVVQTHVIARAAGGEHPLSRATSELATIFFGAIPLEGDLLTPIVRVDDPATWGESEWADYWRTPDAQRAAARLPEPDPRRDNVDRPFTLVGAIERPHPTRGEGVQRLVIVGTNAWFSDPVVRAGTIVDGRPAPAYPGNLELLDAGVLYLAGQDDLIARSAGAASIPRVRPLNPAQRRLILLGLGGVLPSLVGAVGLASALRRR